MTAHPNAHILAQLAEIAKTDPEPWKRLEVQTGNNWVKCSDFVPLLTYDVVFRIKPSTVKLGGMELERPLREAPEVGTKVWLMFDHSLRRMSQLHFPHKYLGVSSGSKKGVSLLPKKPETNTRTRW